MELKPKQLYTNLDIRNDCEVFECSKQEKIFSEAELENISSLCEVLQGIRKRLITEGYSIDDLRAKFNAKNGII